MAGDLPLIDDVIQAWDWNHHSEDTLVERLIMQHRVREIMPGLADPLEALTRANLTDRRRYELVQDIVQAWANKPFIPPSPAKAFRRWRVKRVAPSLAKALDSLVLGNLDLV